MAGKTIFYGLALVILVTIFVLMVELFIPLKIKTDMNNECRNTLLLMEEKNGLTDEDKNNLISTLTNIGLTNITVTGTTNAKQGEQVRLTVECDYQYSGITGILSREDKTQYMEYKKSTVARKVIN